MTSKTLVVTDNKNTIDWLNKSSIMDNLIIAKNLQEVEEKLGRAKELGINRLSFEAIGTAKSGEDKTNFLAEAAIQTLLTTKLARENDVSMDIISDGPFKLFLRELQDSGSDTKITIVKKMTLCIDTTSLKEVKVEDGHSVDAGTITMEKKVEGIKDGTLTDVINWPGIWAKTSQDATVSAEKEETSVEKHPEEVNA